MTDLTNNKNNKKDIMSAIQRSEPGWKHRRRIIYATLIFCAFCILWIMIDGADTRINETIATSAFFLGGTVIAMYVFGATYQDLSVLSKIAPKASVQPTQKKTEKTVEMLVEGE